MTVRSIAHLEARLGHVRAAPEDHGTVALVVRRPRPRGREQLALGLLDPALGLVGDGWAVRRARSTPDGFADPRAQVTVMSHRMVSALSEDPEVQALAGDQLYVDLDLSLANLPPGSLLAVGEAVLEVSDKPHTGCAKFVERFGADAMRFVNNSLGRELRLRGLNARVLAGGAVRPGDPVHKLGPPNPADPSRPARQTLPTRPVRPPKPCRPVPSGPPYPHGVRVSVRRQRDYPLSPPGSTPPRG